MTVWAGSQHTDIYREKEKLFFNVTFFCGHKY